MFTDAIASTFTKMGLKPHESKVYIVLLQNPTGLTVAQITNNTGVKRSTVNLIVDRLIQKGFVTYHFQESRKVYTAEDPSRILFNLEDTFLNFKNIIPFLTMTQFGDKPSKVRYFEGEEAVSSLHKDILLVMGLLDQQKKEISVIVSGEDIMKRAPDGVKAFVKRRVKAEIQLNWIAPESQFTRKYFLPKAKETLRSVKFFDSKKYPFHLQLTIYGNCVGIISLRGKMSGVIIENEVLASSFQSIFNLLWSCLK